MSTISDALKKVQKQRTPDGLGRRPIGAPPREPSRPDREPSDRAPLVAIGVMLFLVVVFLGFSLGRRYLVREHASAGIPSAIVHTTAVQVVVTQTVPGVASSPVPPPAQGTAMAAPTASVPSPQAAPPGSNTDTTAVREVEQAPPADLPVLKGVFYSERAPVAIINESNFQEGEKVGSYQVVRILPTSVIVTSSGREFTLKLK
jgi:hypothetical protein